MVLYTKTEISYAQIRRTKHLFYSRTFFSLPPQSCPTSLKLKPLSPFHLTAPPALRCWSPIGLQPPDTSMPPSRPRPPSLRHTLRNRRAEPRRRSNSGALQNGRTYLIVTPPRHPSCITGNIHIFHNLWDAGQKAFRSLENSKRQQRICSSLQVPSANQLEVSVNMDPASSSSPSPILPRGKCRSTTLKISNSP